MTAPAPRTVADLAGVTGLNEATVRAYIRAGALPGYYCQIPGSKKGTFVIPAEAFARFVRGEWIATPRPVPAAETAETLTLVHRKAS